MVGRAAGTEDPNQTAPVASDDHGRVFADPFNLVTDPAFLMAAWDRVQGNQAARSAGVDGIRPRMIRLVERAFLARLRELLGVPV